MSGKVSPKTGNSQDLRSNGDHSPKGRRSPDDDDKPGEYREGHWKTVRKVVKPGSSQKAALRTIVKERQDLMWAMNRKIIEQRIVAKRIKTTGSSSIVEASVKAQMFALFNDPNSSTLAMWVSNVINLVIMASTYSFVAETMADGRTPSAEDDWFIMECVCVAAFTLDFVVRLCTCPSFSDFSADRMNWVDFIAIVPFYIEGFFTLLNLDSGALSSLRVVRVLRLARVLKIINKLVAGRAAKAAKAEAKALALARGDAVGEDDEDFYLNSTEAALKKIPFIGKALKVIVAKPEQVEATNKDEHEDDGEDTDVGAVIGKIVKNSATALSIPMYFMMLALIVFASLEYYMERVLPVAVVQSCSTNDCVHILTLTKPEECSAAQNCSIGTWYQFPDGNIASSTDGDMFPSIPDAAWWCIVTMTTVGYGDKYPLSALGMIVASMTAMTGIFFISMPLAIVGSSFANAVEKINDNKSYKQAVMDSEPLGYGSLSFTHILHAQMLMNIKEVIHHIETLDRRIKAQDGELSLRDSAFVYEEVFDMRENLTTFTGVLHKELYLYTIEVNKKAAEGSEQAAIEERLLGLRSKLDEEGLAPPEGALRQAPPPKAFKDPRAAAGGRKFSASFETEEFSKKNQAGKRKDKRAKSPTIVE